MLTRLEQPLLQTPFQLLCHLDLQVGVADTTLQVLETVDRVGVLHDDIEQLSYSRKAHVFVNKVVQLLLPLLDIRIGPLDALQGFFKNIILFWLFACNCWAGMCQNCYKLYTPTTYTVFNRKSVIKLLVTTILL